MSAHFRGLKGGRLLQREALILRAFIQEGAYQGIIVSKKM